MPTWLHMDSLAPLAGARVLITGAQGFIGRSLSRLLDSAGAEICCLYRPGTRPTADLPGTQLALDMRDATSLAAALKGVDFVVHLAARSGGIQFQNDDHAQIFTQNHALTSTALQAACEAGVQRIFLASSGVIYQEQEGAWLDESAALLSPGDNSLTGYAWSKITDEVLGSWYAQKGAIEVVIGRFANVYGPGASFDETRSTVVHALVRRAIEAVHGSQLVVWGDGSAVRSFLYIDDAARAALTVLAHGGPGMSYNIDSSQPITIRELAATVRDVVDTDLKLEFDLRKPEGQARRVLDTRRLRDLGFTPMVSLSEGIRATVEDYRRAHAAIKD